MCAYGSTLEHSEIYKHCSYVHLACLDVSSIILIISTDIIMVCVLYLLFGIV